MFSKNKWETAGFQRLLISDRKSTRLNSSHLVISHDVFCLKKKKTRHIIDAIPCERLDPISLSRPGAAGLAYAADSHSLRRAPPGGAARGGRGVFFLINRPHPGSPPFPPPRPLR